MARTSVRPPTPFVILPLGLAGYPSVGARRFRMVTHNLHASQVFASFFSFLFSTLRNFFFFSQLYVRSPLLACIPKATVIRVFIAHMRVAMDATALTL